MRSIDIGYTKAYAMRVNYVGELGWEFHHPIEQQIALFDALMEAGKEFGIRPYGIKAMSSLSIEKSYRLVPRELSIEYNAYESGLDRFVHPNKGQFIGRELGEDTNLSRTNLHAGDVSAPEAPVSLESVDLPLEPDAACEDSPGDATRRRGRPKAAKQP